MEKRNDEEQSKNKHVFNLAKELLDDIELNRLSAEALLLKVSRLARITNASDIQKWLYYEMAGYNDIEPLSLEYLGLTGRWINKNEKKAYWGTLAEQEAYIQACQIELKSLQIPSGENAMNSVLHITSMMSRVTAEITKVSGIKSRVLAYIHDFVMGVYYEKAFSGTAEHIFEKYKTNVDYKIAQVCGDVLSKLPYIYDRLAEGDVEAVSQALNTCRRIIDSFADAIYPPSSGTIEIDEENLKLGAQNHQNRINAFITSQTKSISRRTKLRQNLANLYLRVSVGIHNDVTPEEAQALFFSTYLLLGEVLHLSESPPHNFFRIFETSDDKTAHLLTDAPF